MRSSRVWSGVAVATCAILALQLVLTGPTPQVTVSASFDQELTLMQHRLLSGFADMELNPANANPQQPGNYFPRGSQDCGGNLSSNVRINQNCLNLSDPDLQGRGQAQNEPYIAADPNQPNHVIASYNDYRRGDGTCGVSYSLDKGRTWNDSTTPNNFVRGAFVNKPREYYQASGDTSVAWDTKGNAYLSCQLFKRGSGTSPDRDSSNGMYVLRSTQNFGASFNFPARPVIESNNVAGNFLPLEDKQFMTVDNTMGSPFQDRIYVTWTEFAPTGTAFIYLSFSADYAEHFSPRILVSTNSPLCPNSYGISPSETCNANQFSQPFTGPDGALYVIFNNYNNAETLSVADNRNQILLRKSTDGGATFGPIVKVADFYDLPDCFTYQGKDFGRACVPEKAATTNSIFRAANYPAGAVDPTNPKQVVVSFGSYINTHSKEASGCTPTGINPATGQNLFTGVKTPGACNNDILLSVSGNGGATFTGTTTDPRALATVTTDPGQATTDQWFQWIAFTKNAKLAVSYYDRQYGDDEITGFSDVSLSGSGDLAKFNVQRVTSASMPPPSQFSGTFWGDYAGLSATDTAYPIWSDTRMPELFLCPGTGTTTTAPAVCGGSAPNAPFANDQDALTASVGISSR